MKTSTIKVIHSVKEYTKWKHWPVWYFTMDMENGDKINMWKKSSDAFQLGQEITYITEEADEYGIMKAKHPKPEEMPQTDKPTPTATTPSRGWSQQASFSLSYSKDLCIAGKIEFKDLLPVADVLLERLNSK